MDLFLHDRVFRHEIVNVKYAETVSWNLKKHVVILKHSKGIISSSSFSFYVNNATIK